MSRFWKRVLIVVVVVVVVLVGFRMVRGGGHAGGQQQRQGADAADSDNSDNTPVPVTVETAVQRDVPVYRTALGTVTALNVVGVSPQVGGQLMSLDFKEGGEVKKGQVIARIDPRSLQASYDQANASRLQNEALLATAQANYRRSSDPKYSPFVSSNDLDTQRNQVKQYQAAVAAAAAAQRASSVQLQYTRVLSPIDGVAGIRAVDIGNVVTTGTTLVTVTQVKPIYITFNLPEKDLDIVRSAQRGGTPDVVALDRTDAHPVASDGKLDVIDNQIASDSGTFKLRAVFPNADIALWPGQFVNVRLGLGHVSEGVVVPSQAVQRGPDGDYVYLLQAGDTVKMQTVVQGIEDGDSHVQIVKGLKAGDRVVSEGQFRLKQGSKVKPLKPGEQPAMPTEAEIQKAMKGEKGRGGPGGGGSRRH
ncbi:MAG TPA: efflux RND transporter periplasmic adaptor subunit [Xanthomonadaceae bacterium]|nr:efflux RND transporter periplasmic adaptor subunit [Xanthomonadaceae bacterium]